MTDLKQLYQTDYSEWARRTADLLRAGNFAALDIPHLLEELDDMGKSERRELENRLTILLARLLKWAYQLPVLSERWRELDGRSWRATIVEQRNRLGTLLKECPGTKRLLPEVIAASYDHARELASDKTSLPQKTFPARCPYTTEQILDKSFYPDPSKNAE